jgi:phosphoribosyl 1,2-cyclic phosphodiesterase
MVILDAGTRLAPAGPDACGDSRRVDILLSHLHVDHIQGLGFSVPYSNPAEVHIWGPPSTTMNLRARLAKYLSAPLFPVPLRELPSRGRCTMCLEPFRLAASRWRPT